MYSSSIRTAVVDGFRAALRLHLLLPWYVCLAVLGLLQAWPVWAAGSPTLRNPMLGDLAVGNLDAVINLFLDNPAALSAAGAWALLLLPSALLGGLAYGVFAGGVLSAYVGRRPFWAGCRHFWLSFAALGGLVGILALVVVAIAVLLALLLGGVAGLVAAFFGLALLNMVAEYARAGGVVHDRRNPFVLLGQASTFCARHPGGVLALTLLATLLYVLLLLVYAALARLLGATPLLIVVQQLWVFATLWIKGLRLAWAARYITARTHRPVGVR